MISNEQFKAALRGYAKANGMTQVQIADAIGKPRQTVGHWFTTGIKPEKIRARIIAEHPDIFSDEYVPKDSELAPELATLPQTTFDPGQLGVIVRIEIARQAVANLSDILQGFVSGSKTNRDRFRDELGSGWKNFLELTRAMTGENARKLAIEEGRVRNGNRNG